MYNPENFARIREIYDTKAENARNLADARKNELERIIPGLAEVDALLSSTGLRIMDVIMNHPDDIEARLEKIKTQNAEIRHKRGQLLEQYGYPADYIDVKYECENCNDTGYDSNGKMCRCMKAELIMAGYESSGIADLIHKQKFDNFSLDYYKYNQKNYDNMSRVYAEVKAYTEKFHGRNSGNLLFLGGTGLGKTHLSSAVAGELISRGYDVFYSTSIGLVADFERERFGDAKEGSLTSRYFDCDLLIIDDLGTEIQNQFSATTFFNILDQRLKTGKSMLISTNLGNEELRKHYWDRISSRLFGEFYIYLFTGIDVRQQKLAR